MEAPILSGTQAETSEGGTSRRDKRRAICRNAESLGQVVNSALPKIQITQSHVERSDGVTVSQDAGLQSGRPPSMFPGPSFVPRGVEARKGNVQSSSPATRHPRAIREPRHGNGKPLPYIPDETGDDGVANPLELSRRRKFDEVEQNDVHIRTAQDHKLAQLIHWESMKDEVASVERIWDEIEDDKIYVTSTVDLVELASRRHAKHKRLWSWSKEEKDQFDSQIGELLSKGYALQVVTSNRHHSEREYHTVSYMEYWKVHFTDRSLYWLAILSPEPAGGQSRKKVRRIEAHP